MPSKTKFATKLSSDWKRRVFSENVSDEDDDCCDFSFDNPLSDHDDGLNQSDVEMENNSCSSGQSPDTVRPQPSQEWDGMNSTNNNIEKPTINTGNTANKHGVCESLSHIWNSSNVDLHASSLCGQTDDQSVQQIVQNGGLPHEEQEVATPRFFSSASERSTFAQSRPMNITSASRKHWHQSEPVPITVTVHKVRHQMRNRQQASDLGIHPDDVDSGTVPTNSAYTTLGQPVNWSSDRILNEQLDKTHLGKSGAPPTYSSTTAYTTRIQQHLELVSNKPNFVKSETASPSSSFTLQNVSSRRHSEPVRSPAILREEDEACNHAESRHIRQLSVQSLGVKTGETTQYLPADDTAALSEGGAKKAKKEKGWGKLRAMLRGRKSKGGFLGATAQKSERANEDPEKVERRKRTSNLLVRSISRSQLDTVSGDVYTVTGQVLPLSGPTAAMSSSPLLGAATDEFYRKYSTFPIMLQRKSPRNAHSPSQQRPERSSLSPSPLMPIMADKFGACEDDSVSDSSSETSDCSGSSESRSESGEDWAIERNLGKTVGERNRRAAGQGRRQQRPRVQFSPGLDTASEDSEINYRENGFTGSSDGLISSRNFNKATPTVSKGPYGKLFTAKFYNRVGQKGCLRSVTQVSHVYRGTILVTDLLGGKLLHLARSGRVTKWFEVGQGSEPWCACVTPRGHVAVTLRQPACVTVWSGNGTLLQEFGHDLLQSPTGLACDHQGCFIVADERTNRVLVFSPDGHFLRCLSQTPTISQNRSPGQPAVINKEESGEEGGSDRDERFMNDNVDNKTNKQKSSTTEKTRSKARTNFHSAIQILKVSEKTVQKGRTSSASDATGKVAANVSLGIQGAAVPEPYAFTLPKYVCVSVSGHIIVSDSGSNSVKVFTAQGVYLHSMGSSGSKDGQLKVPYGVCSDQDNNIYVADHYNDRVSVFSIQGEFLQHALTAVSGLCRPKSIAVRPAHVRKLFVAHGGLRTTEVLVYCLESTPRNISFMCDL